MDQDMCFDSKHQSVMQLCEADEVMGKLIIAIGPYSVRLRKDRFESLVRSINNQQLSAKSASTIYERFKSLCGDISPEVISALSYESLRNVGVSKQKCAYLQDLSNRVMTKEIDLYGLDDLDNDGVIK